MPRWLRRLLRLPDPADRRRVLGRLALYTTPTCPACYLAEKAGSDFADAHRLTAHRFDRRPA